MDKFLKLVAKDLLEKYGNELQHVTLVFPNRRAGVFFQKFLSEFTNQVIWAPQILTINDLMKELSGLNVSDRISLILDLYKIYQSELQTKETFDSFYFWGEMLLNDFDDIDKYMVNVRDLFQNISAEKEIEVLFDGLEKEQREIIEKYLNNIRASRDSKQKRDFVAFWKSLFPIYSKFSDKLMKTGWVYEGKVYRKVAEQLQNEEFIALHGHQKFAFVGFNVLNKCEEILFEYLKLNKLAHFYWDYDDWYLQNEFHEAQFFIQPNLQKFPNELDAEYFRNITKGKVVHLVAVSSNVAQIKIVPDILQNKLKNKGNDTAIILSDEGILTYLMNSIPEYVEGINITMGFPVKNSQVVSLINKLFYLKKNQRVQNEKVLFMGRDVQNLLGHYLVKVFAAEEVLDCREKIIQEKQFVIEKECFSHYEMLHQLFAIFSDKNMHFVAMVNKTIKFLLKFFVHEKQLELQLEKELLYHIVKETNKVLDILEKELEHVSIDVQYRIINQVIASQTVSFVGEPIADLQVMGILESRALDFENLIILSMNEGVIPKISATGSFIPYSLREGFGLQTIKHQDSVFSYYFFRLIQRARNVYLVYNTAAEGLASGEPGRYMQQLKYDATFDVKYLTYGFDIDFPGERRITISKSNETLAKLAQFETESGRKYLSPTALNDYIDCSLRFYYKYIQNLRLADEIEEQIKAMHFGNILHETLYTIYKPYRKQLLKKENIQALKKQLNLAELVASIYKKEFKIKQGAELLPGENALLLEIIQNDIRHILDYDEQKAPFVVQSLEEKFEHHLAVNQGERELVVRVGGKIDRIDETAGVLELIDYKTSNPDLSLKTVDALFDSSMKKRPKEVFQLFTYAMLLKAEKNKNLSPQLYITRKMAAAESKNDFVIHFNKSPLLELPDELLHDFEEKLIAIIAEIYNPAVAFTQTEIEEKCSFCDFKAICNRETQDY